MKGIGLKTVNPVVFDDPEYCEDSKEWCEHLMQEKNGFGLVTRVFCGYFKNKKLKQKKDKHLKCQECKDHFHAAKTDITDVGRCCGDCINIESTPLGSYCKITGNNLTPISAYSHNENDTQLIKQCKNHYQRNKR